jgi:aspartate oxidase
MTEDEKIPCEETEIVILGVGSAGLLTAWHMAHQLPSYANLSAADIKIIGRNGGCSSTMSSWFTACEEPDALERKILAGLGKFDNEERRALAHTIATHHQEQVHGFAENVYRRVNGNKPPQPMKGTGISPGVTLPGRKILNTLAGDLKQSGITPEDFSITDIREEEGKFILLCEHKGERKKIKAGRLIVASGGLGNLQEFTTSPPNHCSNVHGMLQTLGVEMEGLEEAVIYPFALNHPGCRTGGLFPPGLLKQTQIVALSPDGSTTHPLLTDEEQQRICEGKHREIFPQLAEKFNQWREAGYHVVARPLMKDEHTPVINEEGYQHIMETDPYAYVIGDTIDYATYCKGLEVRPAYHTTLGGVNVNRELRSNRPNLFAIGEAALIFGEDRPQGGEHCSVITLAPQLAQLVLQELSREKNLRRSTSHPRVASSVAENEMQR